MRNLGVLPKGQNPSAEEYNQVDALIDPMIEDLIARDIIHIQDVNAIEDKYFLHLGHVLAGLAQSEFGMQNDQALTARHMKGEADLEEIDRLSVRYQHMRTMRTDYYPRAVATYLATLFPST